MIPKRFKEIYSAQILFSYLIPFVLINTSISLVISFPLLSASAGTGGWVHLFTAIPFLAQFFTLNLLVGILTLPFFLIQSGKIRSFFVVLNFLCFQAFLFIDTKIFLIFRYHINGLVLNVLTTEGAGDSVILGNRTLSIFIIYLLLILCAVAGSHILIIRFLTEQGRTSGLLAKTVKVLFFAGLSLIILDKGLYAYGDLVNNTTITRNAKLFPLYQPLTVKKFASRVLNIKVNREEGFAIDHGGGSVNYPTSPLEFGPAAKNYNIVLIVVDGLRFDMLDREIMPNVTEFASQNMVFKNHYSGGNGTRFGVFTLLYGIHGAYWHTFLANRVSPVFIDALIDRDYDFRILSSTRLTFPEFRKTAFLRLARYIEDTYTTDDTSLRDNLISEKLISYINARTEERPFFAFLFYNAPHQPFSYPEKFSKYEPTVSAEINYFKDLGPEKADLLRNRYKNAVLFDDHLIGRVIAALREKELLDNTIVLVTGDHGEEFYENGSLGHTSTFDDYQLKTVFVMHYPGSGHHIVNRLTSHVDLVPTLMEMLGCTSPLKDYTQGVSLTGKQGHNFISVANWDNAAIIDNEYKIVFSTELYNLNSFEIRYRRDYSLVKDEKRVMRERKGMLLDTTLQMSHFLR